MSSDLEEKEELLSHGEDEEDSGVRAWSDAGPRGRVRERPLSMRKGRSPLAKDVGGRALGAPVGSPLAKDVCGQVAKAPAGDGSISAPEPSRRRRTNPPLVPLGGQPSFAERKMATRAARKAALVKEAQLKDMARLNGQRDAQRQIKEEWVTDQLEGVLKEFKDTMKEHGVIARRQELDAVDQDFSRDDPALNFRAVESRGLSWLFWFLPYRSIIAVECVGVTEGCDDDMRPIPQQAVPLLASTEYLAHVKVYKKRQMRKSVAAFGHLLNFSLAFLCYYFGDVLTNLSGVWLPLLPVSFWFLLSSILGCLMLETINPFSVRQFTVSYEHYLNAITHNNMSVTYPPSLVLTKVDIAVKSLPTAALDRRNGSIHQMYAMALALIYHTHIRGKAERLDFLVAQEYGFLSCLDTDTVKCPCPASTGYPAASSLSVLRGSMKPNRRTGGSLLCLLGHIVKGFAYLILILIMGALALLALQHVLGGIYHEQVSGVNAASTQQPLHPPMEKIPTTSAELTEWLKTLRVADAKPIGPVSEASDGSCEVSCGEDFRRSAVEYKEKYPLDFPNREHAEENYRILHECERLCKEGPSSTQKMTLSTGWPNPITPKGVGNN
jgi:hypothetical protein